MAWISVDTDVRDHPKARHLSKLLQCSRHEAIGILVMLWMWGLTNATREGKISCATAEDIAIGVMFTSKPPQQLVEALITAGWLEQESNGDYVLHDWSEWQRFWYKAIDRRKATDIEGLSDVIADYADGSKESVNAVAGMAQMTDEELSQVVENWKELQVEEQNVADSMATTNQNYATTLEGLQQQLEQTIKELNLQEEAKNAAEATMDAYIKALQEGAAEAAAIAQQLATQVGTSFNASGGDAAGGGAGGSGGGAGEGGSTGTYTPSQEEMIAVQIVKFEGATGSGMNAGKSGDNGVVSWGGKEYKVQNSGNAYGSSTPLYKAAVEVLGFGDRQIFGYNGKIYGYLDSHIQELEGRAMSSKGYDKLVSDMSANYGSYHTGGLVGGIATLSAGEEFAKLLEGEFVSNPAQMKRFMEDTLPQVAEYGAETAAPQAMEALNVPSSQLPPISVSYHIEISGDAGTSEDQIRHVLDEQNQKLEDMIVDILETRATDSLRLSYR